MTDTPYGDVAGFKSYHDARNHDIAGLDDDDIAASLLVASEWIDAKYRSLFSGTKVGGRDDREWPRENAMDIFGYAIPDSVVPNEVLKATYEAALRDGMKPGSLSVDFTPGKYKQVAVDGAVSATYAGYSSASDVQSQFAIIDEILAPLLAADGGDRSALSGAVTRA